MVDAEPVNTGEFINTLFSLGNFHKGACKLDGIKEVASRLPPPPFSIVHVGGTNGKGSVSEKIFKALSYQGYRVGLFTSPHIATFRERIRTDRGMIPLERAITSCQHLTKLYQQVGKEPTFFELMTLLALVYFSQEQVDIAVFEVGLGGRLDATNIFTPILSVITSISKDHVAILGNSLEQIAAEKAGIIKPGVPVVLGPRANISTILSQAHLLKAPICQVEERGSWYDEENSHIAKRALLELTKQIPLSLDAIEKGIQHRPMGRFEQFTKDQFPHLTECPRRIILDVAHNEDGLVRLKTALDHHFPDASLRLLVGMSRDKDLQACFQLFRSWGYPLHLVTVAGTRLASLIELKELFAKLDIKEVLEKGSFQETLHDALRLSSQRGEILVCAGSFFIMAEIKSYLKIAQPRDPLSLNERYTL